MPSLLIVAVVVASIIGLLFYMDLLTGKKVSHSMLHQSMILYREWQGDMETVGQQFQDMGKELADKLDKKDSRLFGVYFDDPKRLFNPKLARCIIGFILETEDQKRVGQDIASSNPKYKMGVLPETMTLSLRYKYRNPFSILLLGHFWKKVLKQFHSEGLKRQVDTPFVEIYDLRANSESLIHLHYPLENIKELYLSSLPKPAGLDLSK